MLIATFHPELTDDPTVHEYFLHMAAEGVADSVTSNQAEARPSA